MLSVSNVISMKPMNVYEVIFSYSETNLWGKNSKVSGILISYTSAHATRYLGSTVLWTSLSRGNVLVCIMSFFWHLFWKCFKSELWQFFFFFWPEWNGWYQHQLLLHPHQRSHKKQDHVIRESEETTIYFLLKTAVKFCVKMCCNELLDISVISITSSVVP